MCPLLRKAIAASTLTVTATFIGSAPLKVYAQNEAASGSSTSCTAPNNNRDFSLGMHIVAIFVVLVGSGLGITLPILTSKFSERRAWSLATFIIKYFGTGIIVATAFIHLMYEAVAELESPCLDLAYGPTAPLIIMAGMFIVFFVDMIVMRTVKLDSNKAMCCSSPVEPTGTVNTSLSSPNDIDNNNNNNNNNGKCASLYNISDNYNNCNHECNNSKSKSSNSCNISINDNSGLHRGSPRQKQDGHHNHHHGQDSPQSPDLVESQVSLNKINSSSNVWESENQRQAFIDVCILEAGIVFHSVMVGLGLGTSDGNSFIPTFIAITFHQFCDGLAIGTRICVIKFSPQHWWRPWLMCLIYSLITPIGIAIGTGVRATFNPNDPSVILAIGTLDALSAGVLLWGALVDLLGRDCCSPYGELAKMSNTRVVIAVSSIFVGVAAMSVIGNWA